MLTLEEFTSPTLPHLPTESDMKLVLNGNLCPQAPAELRTDRLKLLISHHEYEGAVRYDQIRFFADKPTYQALGLLIFSSVFHPNRSTILHLGHPETQVRQLVVECLISNADAPMPEELVVAPLAYGYWPDVPCKFAFSFGSARKPATAPTLELTNDKSGWSTDEQRAARDIVKGFGHYEGAAAFGHLLLDIGLPQTTDAEFCLEGPSGFGGMSSRSAEARLWVGYDYV